MPASTYQEKRIEQTRAREIQLEKLVSQEHLAILAKRVGESANYKERVANNEFAHPDAYRLAASEIALDDENELSQADRDLLMVTGGLGFFIQASHEINDIREETRGRYVSESDWQYMNVLKDNCIIPFNHALKDFVNTHTDNNIEGVAKNLSAVYGAIFGRYNCLQTSEPLNPHRAPSPRNTLYYLRTALNGMRHEIAAEALLEVANIDYNYETSVSDDAHGIDLIVTLPGHKPIGIDIKASRVGVEEARSKHPLARAVETGLDDDDFTGQDGKRVNALTIPYEVAERKSASFVRRVTETVEHYERAMRRERTRGQFAQAASRGIQARR